MVSSTQLMIAYKASFLFHPSEAAAFPGALTMTPEPGALSQVLPLEPQMAVWGYSGPTQHPSMGLIYVIASLMV